MREVIGSIISLVGALIGGLIGCFAFIWIFTINGLSWLNSYPISETTQIFFTITLFYFQPIIIIVGGIVGALIGGTPGYLIFNKEE